MQKLREELEFQTPQPKPHDITLLALSPRAQPSGMYCVYVRLYTCTYVMFYLTTNYFYFYFYFL